MTVVQKLEMAITGNITLPSKLEHEGRIIKCDVKARSAVAKGYPHRYYQPATTTMDPHKPIFMICVHPVTKQIHWHESRVPTGWEGFWDEATY